MKRFFSLLAVVMLGLQSVVTPVVYATEGADESVGSESSVATEVVAEETDADDGSNDAVDLIETSNSADDVNPEDTDNSVDTELEVEDAEVDETSIDEASAEDTDESVVESTEVINPVENQEISTVVEELTVEGTLFPAVEFEDTTGGLLVHVSAEEGVFPEGTTMIVTPIKSSEAMSAAQIELGDTVKAAIGVDISFHDAEGEEIEPANEQDVHVSLSLARIITQVLGNSELAIIHQDDNGNTESIENVEVDKSLLTTKAEFDHNQFSIFIVAIVDETVTIVTPTCTYTFTDGNDFNNIQTIKNGETLKDPGIPGLVDPEKFEGWFNGDNKIEFDKPIQCETSVDVLVTPKIQNTYYLRFVGSEGETVQVKAVPTDEEHPDPITTVYEIIYTPKGQDDVFVGRSTEQDNSDKLISRDEDSINVSDNSTVWAIVDKGHWITFDENDGGAGGGATYIGPKYVLKNQDVSEVRPADPSWKGYSFDGWYTESEGGEEYVWSGTLDQNITLYAHRTENAKTKYTVIIWQQKVEDSKNAADEDKTYDYKAGYELSGQTNSTIDTGIIDNYKNEGDRGFTYARYTIKDGKKRDTDIIGRKGDTVINIYYDRDLITLEFYEFDESKYTYSETTSNQGTQYGLIDGEYVQLTRHSQGGMFNTSYYRTYGGNNTRYNGTRYTKSNGAWEITNSMEGLYGQTLKQNGYTWPLDKDWRETGNSDGTVGGQRMTFLDSFIENDSFYGKPSDGGDYAIYHYQQNLNGGYDLANSTSGDGVGTFIFTKKYDGFTVSEYSIGNQSSWKKAIENQTVTYGSSNGWGYDRNNLYIRYTRDTYKLEFKDDGEVVSADDVFNNIMYDANLSGYESLAPSRNNPVGFEFAGWYKDEFGTEEFDWSTEKMPAANKVLYAHYTPIVYRVHLDPNYGEFINNQGSDFTLKYQEDTQKFEEIYRTIEDNVIRSGYDLVGWFDVDTGYPYEYGQPTKDINLIAKWRKPGKVSVIYDAGSYGTLKDEWVDTYQYATDSTVKVTGPATANEGYTFIAWELMGNDNTGKGLYYPNGSFEITADVIQNYNPDQKEGEVVLRAKYEQVGGIGTSTEKTTITYKANDGTEHEVIISTGPDGKDLRVNESVEALGSDTFAREGYDLIGWSINPNATEEDDLIEGGDYIAANNEGENILYAIWKIKTYTITFVDEDGTELSSADYDYGTASGNIVRPADPTKKGAEGYVYTFKEWTPAIADVTADATYTATYTQSCAKGYHEEQGREGLVCKKDSGGGGGGSGGGSSYDCRGDIPAHAVANSRTTRYIDLRDYTYGTDGECTFQCESGYNWNGQECTKGGGDDEEEIELGGQVSDKCSVEGSNLSEEEIAAYLYACENDITTIRDINEARLGDYLNRAEMAKIISVFATKELGMKPDTSKDCSNFAASIEGWSQEMKDYMVMSCQLDLMGIHTVNYEAIPDFMPSKHVSRAEFGTILSRVLWGDTYEGTNENYYFRHLDALKANGIITNIDPNIIEYRAWVFLMVYRSVEAIKSGKATSRTSVEEQVNEELEEEANTGTIIGMPNPASVYCTEQGGTLNIVKDDEGNETGMCKLADGTEVEEREYYRANNPVEETETENTTD